MLNNDYCIEFAFNAYVRIVNRLLLVNFEL